VAVALLGLAITALGLRTEPARVRAGSTQPVTDDPESAINTNTSPVAAADPHRPDVLVVAGRVDAPLLNCSVSVSTSGGRAWRRVDLPLPAGARNCFWPDVAFDGDGALLVLFTPTSGPFDLPDSLWLQRFTPGFSDPPNPIVLARSEDGGRTFAPPVAVSGPDRLVVQPSVAALPGGGVLIGALDLAGDRETYESSDLGLPGPAPTSHWRVVAWTSHDGGRTFGPATTVAADVVPVRRVLVDLSPAPAFAVDPARHRIFATWESGHDVLLGRSDDGGASWAPPLPVGPVTGDQFLPGVGVSPGGRLDVAFFDASRDPSGKLAEVVVASSPDGGRSFTHGTASDRRFDPTVGSFNGDTVMLGSHLAVVAQDDASTVVWPDPSRGNRVNNIVDLTSATVTVSGSKAAAAPVAVVGAVVALLGVGLSARSWPARGAGRGRSSARPRGAWRRRPPRG